MSRNFESDVSEGVDGDPKTDQGTIQVKDHLAQKRQEAVANVKQAQKNQKKEKLLEDQHF